MSLHNEGEAFEAWADTLPETMRAGVTSSTLARMAWLARAALHNPALAELARIDQELGLYPSASHNPASVKPPSLKAGEEEREAFETAWQGMNKEPIAVKDRAWLVWQLARSALPAAAESEDTKRDAERYRQARWELVDHCIYSDERAAERAIDAAIAQSPASSGQEKAK